jgi:hypothetical protein
MIGNSIDTCTNRSGKRPLIRLFSMSSKPLCVKGGKQYRWVCHTIAVFSFVRVVLFFILLRRHIFARFTSISPFCLRHLSHSSLAVISLRIPWDHDHHPFNFSPFIPVDAAGVADVGKAEEHSDRLCPGDLAR